MVRLFSVQCFRDLGFKSHIIAAIISAIALVLASCGQGGAGTDSGESGTPAAVLNAQQGSNTEISAAATNVVLILIDDLSHYGFTTYGSNTIRSKRGQFPDQQFSTPNIDKLARDGLRIERAYTHPLCENTRVALMSGKQNNRNYVQPKALHESDITFGDLFKRASYATGMFGKWKQTRGTAKDPAATYPAKFGWDEYTLFDVMEEGQRFINPNLVINGAVVDYRGRTDLDPQTGRRWYGPDIFNRDALAFIEKNKDKPFFLYYPMALVHDDHKPTPDTEPKSLFDHFDEATHNRDGHSGDAPKYLPDMIEYTDKLIGNVVNKLDELDIRERTLVIVLGDNGTKEIFTHVLADGTEYYGRKGGNIENGTRVGMVVNQPGVVPAREKATRTYNGLVYVTDVLPTMLEATGVENIRSNRLDGISFWPQATGASGNHRTTIHSWFIGNTHFEQENNKVKVEYVFDHSFKRYAPSVHYPNGRFFDLRSDPSEKAGSSYAELKWGVRQYSGLDISTLTQEQRLAYERLGKELDQHAWVDVERVAITNTSDSLRLAVGERQFLSHEVIPNHATRDVVVWQSSAPAIVSVDKFGAITAHQAGTAEISIYSWHDSNPIADGKSESVRIGGIQDSITVSVR